MTASLYSTMTKSSAGGGGKSRAKSRSRSTRRQSSTAENVGCRGLTGEYKHGAEMTITGIAILLEHGCLREPDPPVGNAHFTEPLL